VSVAANTTEPTVARNVRGHRACTDGAYLVWGSAADISRPRRRLAVQRGGEGSSGGVSGCAARESGM